MFKLLKRNKRGIEVAVNFIVMLILAIAILAGGLILTKNFFNAAKEQQSSIDSQTQSQIRSMLLGGAKVAIPLNRQTAHRGDFVTFGVGILNVLRAGDDTDDFTIEASACKISDSLPQLTPTPTTPQTYPVKKNDQKIFLVGYKIQPTAAIGTYICDIKVKLGADYYAELVYKAYIIVE